MKTIASTFTPATRLAVLLGAGVLSLAAATGAQAADKAFEKHAAVMCADGSHATDKTGCEKNGGIKATPTKADSTAVQTESSKVNTTGQAPTTGGPSKTPAKPDTMAK